MRKILLIQIIKYLFSQPLQWYKDYLRDHFRVEYNKTLIPKLDFGIILIKNNNLTIEI